MLKIYSYSIKWNNNNIILNYKINNEILFAYILIFFIINSKYYLYSIIINRIKIIMIYKLKNEINNYLYHIIIEMKILFIIK